MSAAISTRWTAEEIDRLREAVNRIGPIWTQIADEMPGRSVSACKEAYRKHERRQRLAEADPSVTSSPSRLKSWQDKRAKERAAEEERIAGLAKEQERSETSKFFGDPLPGRSALDKKLAGIVDPEYFDRRHVHVPKKPTLYTGEAR